MLPDAMFAAILVLVAFDVGKNHGLRPVLFGLVALAIYLLVGVFV